MNIPKKKTENEVIKRIKMRVERRKLSKLIQPVTCMTDFDTLSHL